MKSFALVAVSLLTPPLACGQTTDAGKPSPARIRAAIARIVRRLNTADDHVVEVFGDGSATDAALESAVSALEKADDMAAAECAERLHNLASGLSVAAEAMEMENESAAELHVDLAAIMAE
jgi:hypothetical protein